MCLHGLALGRVETHRWRKSAWQCRGLVVVLQELEREEGLMDTNKCESIPPAGKPAGGIYLLFPDFPYYQSRDKKQQDKQHRGDDNRVPGRKACHSALPADKLPASGAV